MKKYLFTEIRLVWQSGSVPSAAPASAPPVAPPAAPSNAPVLSTAIKDQAELNRDMLAKQLELNRWELSTLRENVNKNKIDANHWKAPGSAADLNKIKADFVKLNLNVTNPVYGTMLTQLIKCYNPPSTDPTTMNRYRDPETGDNLAELQKTDPDFYFAYRKLEGLRALVVAQDYEQKASDLKAADVKAVVPLEKQITGFFKDNWNEFKVDWKTKNWAGVGMRAGAVLIAYMAISKIWTKASESGEPGFKAVRGLAMAGAAGFAVHLLAKTAGYDLPKMIGIKDNVDEVRETSLETFFGIEGVPAPEKINGATLLAARELNMGDLMEAYWATNKNSAQMGKIDPGQFSGNPEFSAFYRAYGLDKDNARRDRIAHELYLIASHCENVFNATYKVNDEVIYGQPTKGLSMQALKGKIPQFFRDTKLRNYADGLRTFSKGVAVEKSMGGLIGGVDVDAARQRLTDVFAAARSTNSTDLSMNMSAKPSGDAKGSISAVVRGYPVRIVHVKSPVEEYVVYDEIAYLRANGNPASDDALAAIPAEGDGKRGAIDLQSAIDLKVEALAGNGISDLAFVNGSWTGNVTPTVPANYAAFGITPTKMPATLIVDGHGGIDLRITGMPGPDLDLVALSSGKINIAEKQMLNKVIEDNTSKDASSVLSLFMDAGKVKVSQANAPDLSLEVSGMNVKVNYVGGKFTLDPTSEKAWLSSPGFASEFAEMASENYVLDDVLKTTLSEIDKAPETYTWQIFKGAASDLWNMAASQDLSATFLQGDINDELSKVLVDGRKDFVKYSILAKVKALGSSATMKDVARIKSEVLNKTIEKVEKANSALRKGNKDITASYGGIGPVLSGWDADDFKKDVLEPLDEGTTKFYTDKFKEFNSEIIAAAGLNASEWSTEAFENLSNLRGVYLSMTAVLDDPALEKATDPTSVKKKEYANYVKAQMILMIKDGKATEPYPGPGSPWNQIDDLATYMAR